MRTIILAACVGVAARTLGLMAGLEGGGGGSRAPTVDVTGFWEGTTAQGNDFALNVNQNGALLVGRTYGGLAGALAAVLLATEYFGFAYSRFAVMEPLMVLFVVASLLSALGDGERRAVPELALAALLMSAAVLTKSSAVFAIPSLLYIAWRRGSCVREGLTFAAATLAVCVLVVGSYSSAAKWRFPEDFTYFLRTNVASLRVGGHDICPVPHQCRGCASR